MSLFNAFSKLHLIHSYNKQKGITLGFGLAEMLPEPGFISRENCLLEIRVEPPDGLQES